MKLPFIHSGQIKLLLRHLLRNFSSSGPRKKYILYPISLRYIAISKYLSKSQHLIIFPAPGAMPIFFSISVLIVLFSKTFFPIFISGIIE